MIPIFDEHIVQRGWFNHELVGQLILDQSDNQSVDQSSSPKQYNQHALCHALWIRLEACVPPGTAAGDLKRVVCKTPNKHVKFAWEKNNWMKLRWRIRYCPKELVMWCETFVMLNWDLKGSSEFNENCQWKKLSLSNKTKWCCKKTWYRIKTFQ